MKFIMKAAILMENSVFVSNSDSHSALLKKLQIPDTEKNQKTLFVKVNLSPSRPRYENIFSPVESWNFSVSQSVLPMWYSASDARERTVREVQKWANKYIHIGEDGLVLRNGNYHFIFNCKNVVICGKARVLRIVDSQVLAICEQARVDCISGKTSVRLISDDAKVTYLSGETQVSSIEGQASIRYLADRVFVCRAGGNATIQRACGFAKMQTMSDFFHIEFLYNNAEIQTMGGTASIHCMDDFAKVNVLSENATVGNLFQNAVIERFSDVSAQSWFTKRLAVA